MTTKLIITKKIKQRGDDGHKVFSIRLKDDTVGRLDNISKKTNRSRNELINIMLDFGINNIIIDDKI